VKLKFYATLQSFADFVIADLERTLRHAQAFRVWAWTRATRANLDTCNVRAAAGEILS
jgi:hypothetical protein